MKTAALGLVMFGTVLIPASRADDASKSAKVEELLKVMSVEQMQKQVFEQIKAVMRQQMGQMNLPQDSQKLATEMNQRVMALVESRLSWEKMKPEYARMYQEIFTEDEIGGIVEFYRSPAGKAMIAKMPALMRRSMELSQKQMADIAPEIRNLQEEMKRKAAEQQKR